MVRHKLSTLTLLLAGALFAAPALAHPGGGGDGRGGAAAGAPGAASAGGHLMGDHSTALGPGNFGANGQAADPFAGSGFGHGRGNFGSAGPAIADDHTGRAIGREEVHPASLTSTSAPRALDNPKLDTALTKALQKSGVALPAGGLKSACAGFGSVGQCVAALHVAQNLQVPGGFDALKAAATAPHASLGKAIQTLEPKADAKAALRQADSEADTDLHAAG